MRKKLIKDLVLQGSPLASQLVVYLLENDEWWWEDMLVNMCKLGNVGQNNVRDILVLVSKDDWDHAHLWWPPVERELTRRHSMDDEFYRDLVYGACFAVFQLRVEVSDSKGLNSKFMNMFPQMLSSMIFADRNGPPHEAGKNPFSPIFNKMFEWGVSLPTAEQLRSALLHVSEEYSVRYPKHLPSTNPRQVDAMEHLHGSLVIRALFYAIAQQLNTGQRADLIISMSEKLSVQK